MARPEVASDHEKLTLLAREQRTMRDIVTAYDAYQRARQEMESAREMLRHEKDPDMQEYLRSEERRASDRLAGAGEEAEGGLLPKDPDDGPDRVGGDPGAGGGGGGGPVAGGPGRDYARGA